MEPVCVYNRCVTLASCLSLRTLRLNGTQVSDVPELASCQSLHTLDLKGTGVSDVSVLASCQSLHTLNLTNGCHGRWKKLADPTDSTRSPVDHIAVGELNLIVGLHHALSPISRCVNSTRRFRRPFELNAFGFPSPPCRPLRPSPPIRRNNAPTGPADSPETCRSSRTSSPIWTRSSCARLVHHQDPQGRCRSPVRKLHCWWADDAARSVNRLY
jgi:hypothetical protein